MFSHSPVASSDPKEQGPVNRVYFVYEMAGTEAIGKTLQEFMEDWSSLGHLYAAVMDFAIVQKGSGAVLFYYV